MRPKEVIHLFVRAFNEGDADALGNLYHEDAINHQMPESPIVGKAAIRENFKKEFAMAKMSCIVENIFEDGEWAMLEWRDPKGLRGCGFFQIVESKIKLQRGYWDKLSFLRIHNLPILDHLEEEKR